MDFIIRKECACKGSGKMFDVKSGKFEKCLHCKGKGEIIIKTKLRCKYCAEPIESGYFCDSCGKAFREDLEEE